MARWCVGEEPECNGPDCGFAEDCPYYHGLMQDDWERKVELKKWKEDMEHTDRKNGSGDHSVTSVCREMRETADAEERQGLFDLRNLSTDSLRAWADLIEEAAKRESDDSFQRGVRLGRATPGSDMAPRPSSEVPSHAKETPEIEQSGDTIAQNPPNFEHPCDGDGAVMREALVQCELFLSNVSRHAHPTLNPGDKCVACAGVDELRGMVVRALSLPARNCDRGFQNAKEAEKVFWQERKAFMDSIPTTEGQLKAIKHYPAFADWLLLPVNNCHQKPYPLKS